MDKAELDFIIADTTAKDIFVTREEAYLSDGTQLGTIVSYLEGDSPQYTHLRSSMLAYVSINLLSMINKFPDTALRVATDSFYIANEYRNHINLTSDDSWGSWRIKDEQLHWYCESADVPVLDSYRMSTSLHISSAPSVLDPITRHRTVYLNGPGGSGKTTRAIELFKTSDVILLTPTHRLAREMKTRGIKAVTYHSFFKYSGGVWNPTRMGEKYIPAKIIWDEICTVPVETLKTFLEWLLTKNTSIVMCGDQGQPPPFIGLSPHGWLKDFVDYYEEVQDDYRALDNCLREFKKLIRLQPDRIQCEIARKIIPETSIVDFRQSWKPTDIIVASRKVVRDHLQQQLFKLHKEKYPTLQIPLCYRPKDTRLQNIEVDIPGTSTKQTLVLNDIVHVDVNAVDDALEIGCWTLGYAMTIHSSQGLTVENTILWIIDNRIEWSNLLYLAVSRVRKMNQLRRIVLDNEINKAVTNAVCDEIIATKIVGYQRSDKKNKRDFDIDVEFVKTLRRKQDNHCASCNCIMSWKKTLNEKSLDFHRQFTVDRKDSSRGHTRDNVVLTCLECNRRRGAAPLLE